MGQLDNGHNDRAVMDFIRKSMKTPLLSREDEFDLARRWREENDEAALHKLVTAYSRLVIATAVRFRNYGLPLSDLMQEGNVGLMQAAARFEVSRDVRFSTYAAWWIKSAMQDFILRNWSIVRTGTTAAQKSLFFNLRRLRAQIAGGEALTGEGRDKIAETLGVPLRDVVQMEQRLSGQDQSLNAPIGEASEDEAQNFIADDRPSPEQVVIGMRDGATRARWLNEALSQLSPRERQIIHARRLQDEGATLEELGQVLGVSKERVRQLENRALTKLRTAILRHVEKPADILIEA
jgi:RNA polymerase sigma-32 factor